MDEKRYMISETSKQLEVEPHVLRYWEEELDMKIKRNEMGHRYYTEEDIRVLKDIRDMKNQGFQLKAIKQVLSEIYENPAFNWKSMLERKDAMNQAAMEQSHPKVVAMQPQSVYQPQAISQGPDGIPAPSQLSSVQSVQAAQATQAVQATQAAQLIQAVQATQAAQPVQAVQSVQAAPVVQAASSAPADTLSAELKMEQFQEIMTKIVGKALESNNRSLSGAISNEVSDKVSERVIKQMDYVMRENEEREEERFRKLDEAIRSRQRANAEAAAALEESKRKKKKKMFGKKNKIKPRVLN